MSDTNSSEKEYCLFSFVPDKITIRSKKYGVDTLELTNSLDVKELVGVASNSVMVLTEKSMPEDIYEDSIELNYSTLNNDYRMILSFSSDSFLSKKTENEEQTYLIKNGQLLAEYVAGVVADYNDSQKYKAEREDDIENGKFYVCCSYSVNESFQLKTEQPTRSEIIEILLQAHSLGLISNNNLIPFALDIDEMDVPSDDNERAYYTFSNYQDVPYVKVHYGNLHSLTDVKNLLATVFSDDYIEKLLNDYEKSGYLIEQDGNLYHVDYLTTGGQNYGLAWLDSYTCINETEIELNVKYQYCEAGFVSEKESKEMEIRTITYHLKRYNDQWKFAGDFRCILNLVV